MDKWLTHNNFAKLIALIFSVILWAMVHIDSGTPVASTTTIEKTKVIDNVQIQVTGFDSDKYVLYELEPDKVRLEVKGKRTNITTNFSDYKVKLDLSNVGPGTITLPLTYEGPSGVQLISMEPSIIKVTIEAKATKEVPVTIMTTGTPKNGLELGTPVIAGKSAVQVTLPESELDDLQKVQGTMDVNGLSDSVKGKAVKLTAYDKQGNKMENAEISPNTVDVDIPLNKMYKNVPIEIRHTGQLPEGYVLTVLSTEVEGVAVYGSKEALEGINSYPITIDLSRFNGATETKFSVDLTPPEGFEKIEPSSVQVSAQIVHGGKKLIDGIPVTFTEQGQDFTAEFIQPADGTVSLTVLGADDIIGKIKPEDIKVTASLAQLAAGKHTIPVTVTLPDNVKLAEPDQSKEIVVELTEKANPATTLPEVEPEPTTEDEPAPANGEHGNAATNANNTGG
ncbi:YbbR domain-containing protein [Fontibacillus panacisegetis]|uniref:YbbR domain-containing protein n=1 Tax=Fontibacillus panacisegetis TaxID=670482 RepID=A0A1G7HHV5_9BACL|nr:CdaR family protein [Fontibacillus panacisegetis]SDF00070.1 YbbR domain-containing protein [Fontibacillus panacisegetis]